MKKKKVIKELSKSINNINDIIKLRELEGLEKSEYWEGATNYLEYALSLLKSEDTDTL